MKGGAIGWRRQHLNALADGSSKPHAPPTKPKKLVAKRQRPNQRGYAAKSSMPVERAARKSLERATKTASRCRRLRRDLRWSASGLGAAPKNLPCESRQSFQNGATQSVPRVSGQSKGSAQLMSGGVFGASAAAGGAHGLGFARRQQCQCQNWLWRRRS